MISRKRKILDLLGVVLILVILAAFFVPVRSDVGLASPCDVYPNCGGKGLVCGGITPKGLPPVEKSYRYNWLFRQLGAYNQQAKKLAPANAASCGGVVVRIRLYVL